MHFRVGVYDADLNHRSEVKHIKLINECQDCSQPTAKQGRVGTVHTKILNT